jgi:hypothetical protein
MPVIPTTWETEIGRIAVQACPGKKLVKPHFNKYAGRGGVCL